MTRPQLTCRPPSICFSSASYLASQSPAISPHISHFLIFTVVSFTKIPKFKECGSYFSFCFRWLDVGDNSSVLAGQDGPLSREVEDLQRSHHLAAILGAQLHHDHPSPSSPPASASSPSRPRTCCLPAPRSSRRRWLAGQAAGDVELGLPAEKVGGLGRGVFDVGQRRGGRRRR